MQQSNVTSGRSSTGEIDNPLPATGRTAVDILINDHQTIKSLLSQLTAASQPSEQTAVLERLKAVLTIHNATEENLAYPAIDKVAGRHAEARDLYHETAEADTAIFEIDTMLKQGGDVSQGAQKLQQAILHHIDNEESKSFKHLQENADPEQAQSLTDSVRKFRSSLSFKSS